MRIPSGASSKKTSGDSGICVPNAEEVAEFFFRECGSRLPSPLSMPTSTPSMETAFWTAHEADNCADTIHIQSGRKILGRRLAGGMTGRPFAR